MQEKTSKKALKELTKSGKKLSYRNRILNFIIERNGATAYEIKSILGIKHETATARISELQDDGFIYVSRTYNDDKNSYWSFEPNIPKQKDNALNRLKIKKQAWIKIGEKNGWLNEILIKSTIG